MSLHERIKEARLRRGITQEQLGALIGVAKTTITGYEKNREPTAAKVGEIADALGVDVNFLFQDEVKALHENRAKSTEMEKLVKPYRLLDPYGQETINIILKRETQRVAELSAVKTEIASLKGRLETCSPLISLEDMRPKYYITYYHKLASAGRGEYLFEDIPTDLIAVEDTPVARRADFVIGVIGDSMEPTYHDGDNVFVEKTDIVKIGEIGIFFIGNECFIKEAGADGLISHNSKYPLIPGSDSIRCVGRILGKAERLQHE